MRCSVQQSLFMMRFLLFVFVVVINRFWMQALSISIFLLVSIRLVDINKNLNSPFIHLDACLGGKTSTWRERICTDNCHRRLSLTRRWQAGQHGGSTQTLRNVVCRSNLSEWAHHMKACNPPPPLQGQEVGQSDLADNPSGLPPLLAVSNALYETPQAR